jgi:cellulose synthase/poly-beta-1,6-N-acetylglucosamine synthase-like glycosyltransferase
MKKNDKEKLSNTFELDYPKNKYNIVANDGSSDNTRLSVNFENIDL